MKIYRSVFLALTLDDLERIIPDQQIGFRIKFRKKLDDLRRLNVS